MSTIWKKYDLAEKLVEVLQVPPRNTSPHLGNPFLTPYQIAIRFKEKYPKDFDKIGKPIGGKNNGQQDSLAQYFAKELSRNVKSGALPNVEGSVFSHIFLSTLEFKDKKDLISSSAENAYDLSMFRFIGDYAE